MVRQSNDDGRRRRQVAQNVRSELSRLLARDLSDPDLAWATITGVEMSPDLRHAAVYYVATGGDDARVGAGLDRAASFLRREVGRALKLRYTPALAFHHDDSFDTGSKIDEILASTKKETMEQRASETPERILARLVAESDRILLCVHNNPDGDAVGSLLGLARVLRLQGKAPVAYCPDGVPRTLLFLPGAGDVSASLDGEEPFDLTILMDTADDNLLPVGFPEAARRGVLFVVDHHMTHGDLGDHVIRRDVSAVGELLFDLARELVWPMDREAAQCFYTSIVADTGSFRYTSTTPRTHMAAAELISMGADPWDAATALFESFPLQRQRLLAAVVGTLAVSGDGRYAQLHCTPEMLRECGATKADLDGMVNLGRAVQGVEIAAMFRVEPEGHVKVSFRSKGNVDVSSLAARFGGGGHRNASGASVYGKTLDEVRSMVNEAAGELLARQSAFDR